MKRIIIFLLVASSLLVRFSTSCFSINEPPNTTKQIVLTFDDGPHPKQTRQILDVLDRYGVKATFFVIGINAKYYPGIIGEVLNKGHELGNHTYSHTHASRENVYTLENQIIDCEQEIYRQTGQTVTLFRPPEGALNGDMRRVIKELGYTNILWTLDTKDWAHTPPEQISEYIIKNAKHGDIILMHDYIGANSPTVQALELFIPVLLENGFEFVTVGELLQNIKS